YMVQLTWPIIALGWVINIFQRGTASLQRLDEILKEQPEVRDESTPAARAHSIEGEIDFRDLNFAYAGAAPNANGNGANRAGAPVLKNVNLRIPAGTSLQVPNEKEAGMRVWLMYADFKRTTGA